MLRDELKDAIESNAAEGAQLDGPFMGVSVASDSSHSASMSGASYNPSLRNASLAANMLAAYEFPVTCMVVCPVDGKVIVAMEINQFLHSGDDYSSFLTDPSVRDGAAACFGTKALPY